MHACIGIIASILCAADPGPNLPDEPIAPFSVQRAAEFLDAASLQWNKDRNCFSCHTNYAYLIARPMIPSGGGADSPGHRAVRSFADEMVAGWAVTPPRRYYEPPGHASYMAINDALTTGKLQPSTLAALERMWTLQKDDGSLRWPDCKWPPMESDQHFGNTMIALAIGMAPGGYAKSPEVQPRLAKLLAWLAANPPRDAHQRAMITWASLHLPGVATDEQRAASVAELRSLQNTDGGWALTRLGSYERGDKKEQTFDSDGYATGFVIYVLRQAGAPGSDPQIQRGISWLKANQRASGRWFTRSAFKDSKHYITHAATAYAVMALAACGEMGERNDQ